jgi:hypothetical protein
MEDLELKQRAKLFFSALHKIEKEFSIKYSQYCFETTDGHFFYSKAFCDDKKFNEKNKEISDEIYSAYLRKKHHE